jgi:hypothetical protein
MVDLSLLQSVSYIAGALGVCVAAFYYTLNIREAGKNRKIALTNTLLQTMASEEGIRRAISIINMEWSDWDDFLRKYDSRVNEENFIKRMVFVQNCNYLGYLVKEGVVDIGSVYQLIGETVMDNWLKLKPVLYKYVEIGDWGKDSFENFEFLANEMIKMKTLRDPEYVRLRIAFPSDKDRLRIPK